MRDPHVVALYYRLETDPSLSFKNPLPVDWDIDQFTLRLADGVLTCTMKGHYATAVEARALVDPFLRAWELDQALPQGRREMWFTFDKADIIDRTPPPPPSSASSVMCASAGEIIVIGEELGLHLTRASYPAPPTRFTASPDVETLWGRYEGYKQGREPLLAMASACVTFLTAKSRGREGVKKTYAIDLQVLRTLDNFAANLGDEHTARKFHVKSTYRPPTPQEVKWIDAAIRMLIRRVGEYAADPTASWPMLSMRDLPPL